MANYNRVILMGNLTRDPELRYLPSNMPVVGIGLAVNERWKNKQSGEWEERANFIDCEAFGRTAEVINQYFSKGRPIMIEGKLRLDQWQSQDGQNRSKLKVVIDSFEFVGGRGDEPGGEGGGGGGGYESRGDYPRSSSGGGRAPSSSPGPSHQPVEEGDIPF